jgi:predicted adenylyl cyclase CyaB
VRVGAHERVAVGERLAVLLHAEHHLREVLEVHLVADARARRHHAEVAERRLAPLEELVALGVALELLLHVDQRRGLGAVFVDLHGVVDDQIHRLQRVDARGIAAELHDRVAHGGQVDHARHAGEVLQQHARERAGIESVLRRRYLCREEQLGGGYVSPAAGAIAQLVERLDRTQEVSGSNPLSSTPPEAARSTGFFMLGIGCYAPLHQVHCPPRRSAPSADGPRRLRRNAAAADQRLSTLHAASLRALCRTPIFPLFPLSRTHVPTNIEIKARATDLDRIAARARDLGGGPETLIIQEDVFFRVADGKLKLRIFPDGTGQLIRYRRASGTEPRPSDYTIAPTTDPAALRSILSDVLGQTAVVKKRRRLILIDQTRVHLDEVEGLGSFVELEVVLRDGQSESEGRTIAADLMTHLGISEDDLLSQSYVDMMDEGNRLRAEG